ncbi:hypothetical protein, partial [Stutzerimonas kunmingensis]|uniref:hypothetical protein n=1 Tax=Stutzerimonas kunmingensis TaxID=1211807 RepID=UPI00241EA9B7
QIGGDVELSQPMLEQMISKLLPQVSMFAQQFRNSAPAKLKEAAKTGQIKAMQRTLAPTSKVERLARLDYEIVEFVGPPLVLGDSIVLFQVESERAFRPFLDGSDKLVAVYLPLSPRQVLVGANASMTLDSACLRREIARCSLEHFVASEAPPQHDDLVSLIGENANLLTVDQADAIMSELLTK